MLDPPLFHKSNKSTMRHVDMVHTKSIQESQNFVLVEEQARQETQDHHLHNLAMQKANNARMCAHTHGVEL